MLIYMLKFKDQALDAFETFSVLVESEKEREIKILRTTMSRSSHHINLCVNLEKTKIMR